MKRMEVPALFFSVASNLVSRLQRFKPNTIIIPPKTTTATTTITTTNDADDAAKVAIVTGSNTGVGYETAKALVNDHGYKVVIACRSPEKGKRACEEINKRSCADNNNNSNNNS
eukprot:CAMPEP_0178916874 /NCGR_PEP_ID=MMETSP0786-20121207/12909_1 /TAXON_ID=186022 /ORGANISM="Thalassionema frauenfeldii, Strain CCMP 1798" /LENGTH=113 /DNA_ID=CAMNT_0020590313 /DNA_START=91 /DNA_END=429 /DNA_ORIENTATION=-